jgi:hypothetical protein
MPESLLKDLREVSENDLEEDLDWAVAPTAVLSNFERERLNQMKVSIYARMHNLPLVRWRKDVLGSSLDGYSNEILDELYVHEPGLWAYFCKGAPGFLLANTQPTKGLANGAAIVQHSLSFQGEPPAVFNLALNGSRFVEVELLEPPLSVNLELVLPDDDDGVGIETLVPGSIVFPLILSNIATDVDLTSLFAAIEGLPKTVQCKAFQYTLGFALTDFKIQGKTFAKLIMSICGRPFPPHLNMRGLYVMISRVRTRNSLRVLNDDGNLRNLCALRYPVELGVWDKGYSSSGDWDAQAAQMAGSDARGRPKAPKRKSCKSIPVKEALQRVSSKY